jgi:hypothetical protein
VLFKPSSMGKEVKKVGVSPRQITAGMGPQMTGHAAIVEHTCCFLGC